MRQTFLQKYLTHPLQGIIVHCLFWVMGLVPVDQASAMGGWIARTIGPKLPLNKRALNNLILAFPEKSKEEIDRIIYDMWDNLGRMAFEYPHINKFNLYENPERFEIIGQEVLTQMATDEQCGIFFSAHMANWEISPRSAAQHNPQLPVHSIYREPDNPWMKSLFENRLTDGCGLIPKGAKGAREALNLLKSGGHLAILVDQKLNDGIAVPFFGRDAMTAPAIAQFALKFKCPVSPMRIERIDGFKFRLTIYPPIEIKDTGNRQEDILKIMTEVNQTIEDWIRERPAQWLWLHRRWPK